VKATSDIHLHHVKIYLCISGAVDRDGLYPFLVDDVSNVNKHFGAVVGERKSIA
jgi:hypothetical protein